MNSGVYLITNNKNSKRYVGSSVNLSKREGTHFRNLRQQTHVNTHLQNAWGKWGGDAFSFHVLALCAREKKSLLALEQHFIDLLRPEYNICKVAGSNLGLKGHKLTDEHRANLSAALKGRPGHKQTDETRAKISASRKGKTSLNKGKPWSVARRAAENKRREHGHSCAHKGRPWSEARRAAYNKQKERVCDD